MRGNDGAVTFTPFTVPNTVLLLLAVTWLWPAVLPVCASAL